MSEATLTDYKAECELELRQRKRERMGLSALQGLVILPPRSPKPTLDGPLPQGPVHARRKNVTRGLAEALHEFKNRR